MSDDHPKIDTLIETVRQSGAPALVSTGAVALLNLIPYAGGAVAGILGEFSSQRRIEKVCDVLAELNRQLETRHVSPDAFLSSDQVVELVYETLLAAAIASDERKREALKAGLVRAFVTPGPFERKQLFLQMLRETTVVELLVLRELYEVADPFIVGRQGPTRTPENGSPRHLYLAKGFWLAKGRTESPGGQTVLKLLVARSKMDAPLVEGALRRLDARGLSSVTPNLERSDIKVVEWLPMPEEHVAKLSAASIAFEFGKPFHSPVEASRTKLGGEFLRFWLGMETT